LIVSCGEARRWNVKALRVKSGAQQKLLQRFECP
jgi:hypothetical protein